MSYFYEGLGVALGIILGILVGLAVKIIFDKKSESQKLKNIKFEFKVNISQFQKWLDKLKKYRDCVKVKYFITTSAIMIFQGLSM